MRPTPHDGPAEPTAPGRRPGPVPEADGHRRRLLAGIVGAGAGAMSVGSARADATNVRIAPAAERVATTPASATEPFRWAPVTPSPPMRFPEDFGAHPDHRTEWWYVTGWLRRPGAEDAGFQLTFFRSRTAHPAGNPSRFAPTTLVLAHAALALPERGQLLHAERAARAGFGLALAAPGDTRLQLGAGAQAWRLERDAATDRYVARIASRDFDMALSFDPGAPPLLQGDAGFSRKGPSPQQASRYYSRPQLRVTGSLRVGARSTQVEGTGWFDHEWSSEILDGQAVGWDWTGINLDDGGALMAFRIRSRDGGPLWQEAMWRAGRDGPVRTGLRPAFEPVRHWRSPRNGANWPVQMRVQVDGRTLELRPLFDDQELDARGSTGTTYWEGAVTAFEDDRRIGRGYLELTGYAGALRL